MEYQLTELGGTFIQIAIAIGDWAIENRPQIESARADYDAVLAARQR